MTHHDPRILAGVKPHASAAMRLIAVSRCTGGAEASRARPGGRQAAVGGGDASTSACCRRVRAEHCCRRKVPERFLFRPCQVCILEGGSCGRGSQLMECPLGQGFQGILAISAKVPPSDLGRPAACASWDARARQSLRRHGPLVGSGSGSQTGRSAHRFPRPRGVSRA